MRGCGYIGLCVIVAALVSGPAGAQFERDTELPLASERGVSITHLFLICREHNDESFTICTQIINAALDTHDIIVRDNPEAALYCVRYPIDAGMAMVIFLRYAEKEKPGFPLISGAVGVMAALAETYPCL